MFEWLEDTWMIDEVDEGYGGGMYWTVLITNKLFRVGASGMLNLGFRFDLVILDSIWRWLEAEYRRTKIWWLLHCEQVRQDSWKRWGDMMGMIDCFYSSFPFEFLWIWKGRNVVEDRWRWSATSRHRKESTNKPFFFKKKKDQKTKRTRSKGYYQASNQRRPRGSG